jgi:antitoxin (DNA-binding transcriptional repressor) of toxin-antitoxin stability system
MTKTISLDDAKDQLDALVRLATNGNEVTILDDGVPVAQIVPPKSQKRPIKFGTLKGKVWIADDFDAPLPDAIIAEFEGR